MQFLSDKMEATAKMVGRAIVDITKQKPGPWQTTYFYSRIGAMVLGRLCQKNMVMRIPKLNAWRLTTKGREWISKYGDGII